MKIDVENASVYMAIPKELSITLNMPELGAKRSLLEAVTKWSDLAITELSKSWQRRINYETTVIVSCRNGISHNVGETAKG